MTMHPVKEVAFERFKAFYAAQRLNLRPITVLFGQNSVGKSAALRLLPFLAASCRRPRRKEFAPTVFDYSSPAMRGAMLSEIISLGRKGSDLKLSIVWSDMRFEFSVRDLGLNEGELITKFRLETPDGVFDGHLTDDEKVAKYDIDHVGKTHKAVLMFDGLRPVLVGGGDNSIVGPFSKLSEVLSNFGDSVHWLSSVRSLPPRFSRLGPGASIEIGPDGSGVAAALHNSLLRKDGVAEKVSSWLQQACGSRLVFAQTEGQVSLDRLWFELAVQSEEHPDAKVSIQDVGEGIAQALPVVTLCRQAQLGLLGPAPILAFEQPELHLHPRAEQRLAEELVACVAEGSPAIHLVETHSEALLLALQIALVEKRITPETLQVYWVDQTKGQSTLHDIGFDESGYPSEGWPPDVFAGSLAQARRLAQLRLS